MSYREPAPAETTPTPSRWTWLHQPQWQAPILGAVLALGISTCSDTHLPVILRHAVSPLIGFAIVGLITLLVRAIARAS